MTKILNFTQKPELELVKDEDECPKCDGNVTGYLDFQTKICYNCREAWDE